MPPSSSGVPEPDTSQDLGRGSRDVRFRELVARLPVALYTTDRDGYLTYFNQAAVALVGRPQRHEAAAVLPRDTAGGQELRGARARALGRHGGGDGRGRESERGEVHRVTR